MSTASTSAGFDPDDQIRPLSVRMTEGTRAQLDIIAQMNDRSVTEEVRAAIEAHLERSKSDPKVLERAEKVKAEIERKAATERRAIAAIFDPAPKGKATKEAAPPPARPAS